MEPINLVAMKSEFDRTCTMPYQRYDKKLYFQINYIIDHFRNVISPETRLSLEKYFTKHIKFDQHIFPTIDNVEVIDVQFNCHFNGTEVYINFDNDSYRFTEDTTLSDFLEKDDMFWLKWCVGELFLFINTVSLIENGTVTQGLYDTILRLYRKPLTFWNRKLLLAFVDLYNKQNQRETLLSLSYRTNILYNKVCKVMDIFVSRVDSKRKEHLSKFRETVWKLTSDDPKSTCAACQSEITKDGEWFCGLANDADPPLREIHYRPVCKECKTKLGADRTLDGVRQKTKGRYQRS